MFPSELPFGCLLYQLPAESVSPPSLTTILLFPFAGRGQQTRAWWLSLLPLSSPCYTHFPHESDSQYWPGQDSSQQLDSEISLMGCVSLGHSLFVPSLHPPKRPSDKAEVPHVSTLPYGLPCLIKRKEIQSREWQRG